MGLGTIWVTGLKCPVAAGEVSLTQVALIGKTGVPGGKITVNFDSTDQNGEEVICLDVTMSVNKKKKSSSETVSVADSTDSVSVVTKDIILTAEDY
jgi:hypothetical protein